MDHNSNTPLAENRKAHFDTCKWVEAPGSEECVLAPHGAEFEGSTYEGRTVCCPSGWNRHGFRCNSPDYGKFCFLAMRGGLSGGKACAAVREAVQGRDGVYGHCVYNRGAVANPAAEPSPLRVSASMQCHYVASMQT